ncbi:MAG: hypothetical protein GVY10_01675 [Verrucomicrobia bacterium]|nr:hypothetical protein [Verrucomicrobiota bacterium]
MLSRTEQNTFTRTLFIAGFLLTCCFPLSAQGQGTPPQEEATYILQSGDVIAVRVFNEPDLSVEQEIDPNGVIIIPLLGRTNLSGKSLREAESFLENQFIEEEYLIHPQVTVTIVRHAEKVFYVFGEVNSPGAKTFPSGEASIDILEAITLAGDLSQYAKRSDIVVRRPLPNSNEEEKFTVDLDKMIRGNKRRRSELVQIYPQDIIFVPERLF